MGPKEQFTPGPWKVGADNQVVCYAEGDARDGMVVAESIHEDADATLIAAAPDLYEALKALVEHVHNAPITVMSQVDNALEKANGRTGLLKV